MLLLSLLSVFVDKVLQATTNSLLQLKQRHNVRQKLSAKNMIQAFLLTVTTFHKQLHKHAPIRHIFTIVVYPRAKYIITSNKNINLFYIILWQVFF